MYYKCVKFHKNPISRLGGVALTRYMDGRTDGQTDGRTDGQGDSYIPPNFVYGGYNYMMLTVMTALSVLFLSSLTISSCYLCKTVLGGLGFG